MNKVDICWLSYQPDSVKDFFSFVGVKRSIASTLRQQVKDQKIKNKKVKIDIAK